MRAVRVASTGSVLATGSTKADGVGADGFIRFDSYGTAPVVAGTVQPKPQVLRLPDLAEVGIARLGGQMKMRVVSIPGEQVVLAVAGRGANVPLGAMGTLRIDPSTMVLAGAGKTSNVSHDPRIEFMFQVPNDTKLLGLPLFWQAVVGVSFRANQPQLTNVFITSIR